MPTMKHREYYNWSGATFEVEDGAPIICQDCNLNWCEHQEEAIRNQMDTEDLFSEYHWEGHFPKQVIAVVPIFPTHEIWHSVKIVPAPGLPVRAFQVYASLNSSESLGYLTEGEGRDAIRSLLLSQLVLKFTDQSCTSSRHGYKQEVLFKQNFFGPKKLIEQWCLVHNSMCFSCFRPSMSDDPFDDLIPDKEPSKW